MKINNKVWFKDLPSHWEVSKIASTYKLRNQKVSDRDFEPLSVTMKGIFPQWENVAKSDAHDDRKLVRKGDFVINSRSDRRGSCGISDRDGSVSLINLVLQPLTNMYPGYYNWLFHTESFADEFYKWGHGIVNDLWSTSWQEMKKILIPQPPIEEQIKISTILDKKCCEIDGLIADIEKEIEVLTQYKKSIITETVTKGLSKDVKLKKSKICWISLIPEYWEESKIKYYLLRKTVRNPGNAVVLSLYREYGIVPKDSRDDNHNVTSEDTSKYLFVKKGQFVINKMKAWQGSMAISKYEGIVSPAYYVYDFRYNNLCKEYLHYLLKNPSYIEEFRRLSGGIREGQWDLPAEQFENLLILIPPIQEQKEIAEYLDRKCEEIDSILKDKNKQLETLESYKKSIIYEYVTGKKEVEND